MSRTYCILDSSSIVLLYNAFMLTGQYLALDIHYDIIWKPAARILCQASGFSTGYHTQVTTQCDWFILE